jgi:DNA processing protein
MRLVDRGFCIVSGMARGVDAAAHEGALSVKGTTVSVLGNGIDVIYPYENRDLRRRIVEDGAIISEFPLGHRPDRLTFPIRNRIIAGMCHAVIVVESDKFGGSMITARFANDYGRHVFAVPGRIDTNQSSGCFSLIKDGAIMLTCVEDIFDELPYLSDSIRQGTFELKETNPSHETESIDKSKNISCPVERLIYDILKRKKVMSADDVINESNLQTKQVLNALQMLEIRGITFRRYDGLYELKR